MTPNTRFQRLTLPLIILSFIAAVVLVGCIAERLLP
jgi:hypothetical protein